MAGPVFIAAGSRTASAGTTSLTPNMPTTSSIGFLLAVVTTNNNETHTTATPGWTKISQVNNGASFTASLWYAAGSASGPTFSWTSSVPCQSQVTHYADDSARQLDSVPGATQSNSGASSTHSTTGITTTRNPSLAVYVDAAAANTDLATPAGWTENSDAGGTSGRLTFGSKSVAGGSSGAISVSGANAAWVQWQVEVMLEAPEADTLAVAKVEVGAWEEPPDGANFSKAEVGAWLDAPTEFSVSKAEVGAWLDFVGGGYTKKQAITIF